MKIQEAREEALWNYVNNTPGGHKNLATTAIQVLPYSMLKKLVEALDLDYEVEKLKKQKK